jgi:hypothetical protein
MGKEQAYWTFVVNYHKYAVAEIEKNVYSVSRIEMDADSQPETGTVRVETEKNANIWSWIKHLSISEADRPGLIHRIVNVKGYSI